jgi:hypothetical protein
VPTPAPAANPAATPAPAQTKTATLNDLLSISGLTVKTAAAPPSAATASPAPAATAPAGTGKAAGAAPAAPATGKTAAGKGSVSQPAHDRRAPPRTSATQAEPAAATGASGADSAPQSAPAKEASYVNEMGLLIENGKIVGVDARVYRTEAQQKLASFGQFIIDPAQAEVTYAALVQQEQAEKSAELTKLAEEERARGALQWQGMLNESTAFRRALGEITDTDVAKVAFVTRVSAASIMKRASAMFAEMKRAEVENIDVQRAAAPGPALVDGNLGTAARANSSASMEAADRNEDTTLYAPEGVAGTRQPVEGQDEKIVRFTDVYTLPGSGGVNLGVRVDQGKALGQ